MAKERIDILEVVRKAAEDADIDFLRAAQALQSGTQSDPQIESLSTTNVFGARLSRKLPAANM